MKELGAAIYNCSCLAQDLGKIFEAYWALGVPQASIPEPWPDNFSTSFNAETPLELALNGTNAAVYFSVGKGEEVWNEGVKIWGGLLAAGTLGGRGCQNCGTGQGKGQV